MTLMKTSGKVETVDQKQLADEAYQKITAIKGVWGDDHATTQPKLDELDSLLEDVDGYVRDKHMGEQLPGSYITQVMNGIRLVICVNLIVNISDSKKKRVWFKNLDTLNEMLRQLIFGERDEEMWQRFMAKEGQ